MKRRLYAENTMERRIPHSRERFFRAELERYRANGRLVHWYATDHHYVIVLRDMVFLGLGTV